MALAGGDKGRGLGKTTGAGTGLLGPDSDIDLGSGPPWTESG